MQRQIDNVTPHQRIAECDKHRGSWSNKPAKKNSPNDFWTWIATGLIALLLVVSGYMDQESGMFDDAYASAKVESYASIFAAPQLMIAGAQGQK